MAASANGILIQVAPIDSNFTLLLQNRGKSEEVIRSDLPEPIMSASEEFTTETTATICLSHVKEEPQDFSSNESSTVVQAMLVNQLTDETFAPDESEVICNSDKTPQSESNGHESYLENCDSIPESPEQAAHMRVKREEINGPCSAEFALESALNSDPQNCVLKCHMRMPAECEKAYKCDHCPATFFRAWNLKQHVRKHTGERPYECHLCPAAFSLSGGLRRHMRTHTGERPFQCKLCSDTFRTNHNLKIHMNTHMELDKPYRCEHCSAAFLERSKLKRHGRIHTGETPYTCRLCPSAFARLEGLGSHMQTHHGENMFKCHLCPATFTRNYHLKRHIGTHGELKAQYK